MESSIVYIKGRLGVPRKGYLHCDGTNLTLKNKDVTQFATKVNQVKAVKYTGKMSFTVILETGEQYIFQDIDWHSPVNIVMWLLLTLSIPLAIILAYISLGSFYLVFVVTFPLMAIIYFYSDKLKKVSNPPGMKPKQSLVLAWRNYFTKTLNIPLQSQNKQLS